ncbi:MAG: hypothetical protein R2813_02775 [Flavobacteriales bacterium]
MKTTYLSIVSAFVSLVAVSQTAQTYKGPYSTGFAEYTYTENAQLQRLMNGRFSFADTITVEGRGECDFKMSGGFRDDKKMGPWVASVKALDNSSNETVTGPYLNGQKSGLWTHRLTVGEVDIKTASASFNRGIFKAAFAYHYGPTEPIADHKVLDVTGSFDDKGKFDGEWKVSYADMNGAQFEDVLRFQHGVMTFRVKRAVDSGKELERFEDDKLATAFFANMNKLDSSSIVDDKKYGIRAKATKHEIIVPLMKAWIETDKPMLGNTYAASIPTAIINKGEVADPAYLMAEAEIIDWKETPKGKAEWEEQQRILKEYNAKIKEADAALAGKQLEESLRLYRLASTIKKDETYPGEQVKVVEDMIKVRNRRNKLVESVNEKAEKWDSENKKIMANEEFAKKQKHLFEAYGLGYDYLNRKLRGDHSKVQSNISNNLIDNIEISELEAYESDLVSALSFQTKTTGWIGKESKDLEKELKKLETPKEIVERLDK